ncbi:chromosomal replication initiator DnaA [Bosea caraganae]|uniref:Chromosomal replication initiator DnaA n=1 Tax=Bosea caraganae TaxID=2763117 RepID=A0A370L569_9HYPH|nr:helix-turn-helix domain-containing protein [Bosea caraganae]RDJ23551.1 chromosomal replication initiator DnaA [Bosea caraganae]RDJ24367.1 chromosomal replication initiator DnaA [Bosea caraganae]
MNDSEINLADPLRQTALARLIESAASATTGISTRQLRQRLRGTQAAARSRQMAMYLAHVVFGLSFTRVGICFGRDRTTVRHACALIEDRRDDPRHDLALAALEAGLLALTRHLIVAARVEA